MEPYNIIKDFIEELNSHNSFQKILGPKSLGVILSKLNKK